MKAKFEAFEFRIIRFKKMLSVNGTFVTTTSLNIMDALSGKSAFSSARQEVR